MDTYGVTADVIATGVDLEFLTFSPERDAPSPATDIVFTAAMDSFANIDGLQWFMDDVWPRIVASDPAAKVCIVGRNPEPKLVRKAKERGLPFTFTGFVDDVRPVSVRSGPSLPVETATLTMVSTTNGSGHHETRDP